MPIYEYRCQQCGHKFEMIVHREGRPVCPSCKADRVDKQISGFAVGGTGTWAPSSGPCGSCGDPRGPGSCSMN